MQVRKICERSKDEKQPLCYMKNALRLLVLEYGWEMIQNVCLCRVYAICLRTYKFAMNVQFSFVFEKDKERTER